MANHFMVIHVLAAGDLFADVLKAITAFMSQNDFLDLLRITALIGIIMITIGFLKSRDPMVFAKWFLGYVLCTNLLLIPKTSVLIADISTQNAIQVGNVPVVFAATASLFSIVGYELAQSYDMLFATPGDFEYTKTGALFGAKLIEAAQDFRIIDPTLKDEMDHYFRSCVVGDIKLNKKYSVGDLTTSTNIWDLISQKASPLRMTVVNGALVTCKEASLAKGEHSLKNRLEAEIQKAYSIFGVNLFGKQTNINYSALFDKHLSSAALYYQGLTDTSSNIFLQAMMINAINDGINHYQAFTDNTASVVNHEFSKAQMQDRWSWEVFGRKAVWFLPLLHTNLLLILFGVFPLVLALATLPSGGRIAIGYVQFLLSLQCWPVLFAVINHAMSKYGMSSVSSYGAMTMVNLDKMTELSRDISGVAGYIMIMIPFLAKGMVSNLSEAFNGLATSITGQVQSSGVAAAGEAASASFGLGQTSFYNTSANNFSANKHDTNWTHMRGMHSEQLGSGVIKTTTGTGQTVFDVSPGMTKGAVHISDAKAMSGSLNQAYEESTQAAKNESQHYQSALSNFAHNTVQLSKMKGHELRLGDGVSENESGQYNQALSTMTHIASDISKRAGVTQEDALARMTSMGVNGHLNYSSDRSALGSFGRISLGISGGIDANAKAERSSTSNDRFHESTDTTITAKEASDFNQALNYVSNFAKNHHFDDSHSEGANLSNQIGADLRDAQTASHNYDASMSKAARISSARSYVESNSEQISTDLNQAFSGYVAHRVGKSGRDALYAHPENKDSLNTLQELGKDFLAEQRDGLIAHFGTDGKKSSVEAFYHQEAKPLEAKEAAMGDVYHKNSNALHQSSTAQSLGLDTSAVQNFQQRVGGRVDTALNKTSESGEQLERQYQQKVNTSAKEIATGKQLGQTNVVLPDKVTKWIDHHDKSAKTKEPSHE